MLKLFSHPRFLTVYSGVLTVVFLAASALSAWHASHVAAAEKPDLRRLDFDQLNVHRINIIEPDGTPRLVISAKAEFPGGFFKGKELTRGDRSGAGMLFMNDEGTENGGLMFGGERTPDGNLHSSGHLSFDEYEQDQTISLDTYQDGDQRYTAYQINDNSSDTLFTPEVLEAFSAVKALPEGSAKQKAWKYLLAKYPAKLPQRASLERGTDKSAALRLRDANGRTRILLRVAADGASSLQFLDAAGKVMQQWPEAGTPPRHK